MTIITTDREPLTLEQQIIELFVRNCIKLTDKDLQKISEREITVSDIERQISEQKAEHRDYIKRCENVGLTPRPITLSINLGSQQPKLQPTSIMWTETVSK